MLYALLGLFLVLVVVFAVLTFAVHHLFLIGFIIAGLFVVAHGGFLTSRRS